MVSLQKLKRFLFLSLAKQYTSIGGQAVIEGVMMRSPHSFVIALRKSDGKIKIRKDQWFGLGKRFSFFKKPFLRGILMLIESMANGIVALNYSANVAIEEEEKKKGKEKTAKQKDFVHIGTFITMGISVLFGLGLFVFLPHAITMGVSGYLNFGWQLDSFSFHAFDGFIKGIFFIAYVAIIGLLPDIRRVFQYHGAEHKAIATFEACRPLEVEQAQEFSTLHPRCGTSFLFFLIFISIVLFSGLFVLLPIPGYIPSLFQHIIAVICKIVLMLPIAGISYELIRLAGRKSDTWWAKAISWPGMMLQHLTTKSPDDKQLEVALASLKMALHMEEFWDLKNADQKVFQKEEVEIQKLEEIAPAASGVEQFLAT